MRTLVQCGSVTVDGLRPDFQATVVVADDLLNLNHLTLTVAEDYYTRYRRRSFSTQTVSAAEYLEGNIREHSGRSMLCQEMAVPRHLLHSVGVLLPRGAAWTTHALSYIHAGRTGTMTPLHFDWDMTWVANICLTGRKRFFIFPPSAGWLLSPVLNLSALCVPKFSEADRHDLVAKLGGVEVVLSAGEGLLFPSLSWHGVLYEESSLSLSVRFEPKPGGRPFAALPRSWLLQRLLWRFFAEGYGSSACEFLLNYLDTFFARKVGWRVRYRRVNEMCRRFLLEAGEGQGAAALSGENFSTELALARETVKRCYTVPLGVCDGEVSEGIADTADYIFERLERPAAAGRLAEYAFRQQQGLRPRRGLVQITN